MEIELQTVKEVAEILKVSKSMIYTLVARNELDCIRVGVGRGTIRIHRQELLRFMEGQNSENHDQREKQKMESLKFVSISKTT